MIFLWWIGGYAAIIVVLALIHAYCDGRGWVNGSLDTGWLILIWPLMLLVIIVGGPFALAYDLGERARLAAWRKANELPFPSPPGDSQ